MIRKYSSFLMALLLSLFICNGAIAATLYDDGEIVIDSSNLYPKTDGGNTLGKSGNEFAGAYVDSITLGGSTITGWGSVVSPWTDASTYVYPTDAGNYIRLYDAGYLRLGDATNAGSYYILTADDSDSWYAGQYTTTDDYIIGYGSTIGTTPKISIRDSATTTTVVIGDASQYDHQITFDGNAQDYSIGLDDTADDLIICLGSALGTTTAIGIDENLAIATYGDITMGGSTPTLTIGDAGEEDAKVIFDGNAQDFYVGLEDATDDLEIGLGSTLGTTPAISINEGLAITTYADVSMTGTTPTLTVGDGGNEDNQLVFSGASDFTVGVDATASLFEITNGLDVDQTTAFSIADSTLAITTAGDVTMAGTTVVLTLGDAGDEDITLLFDGQTTKDFYMATDATDDTLILGVGSTVGTDSRIKIQDDTTLTNITIGDAAEYDMKLIFDGNAQDFHIGLDDSVDDFIIGLGDTLGTTPAISINELCDITTYANITMTGTVPKLIIGDGGDEDAIIDINGQGTDDYHIGFDTTDDDLKIGYGLTPGTTPRITLVDSAVEVILGDATEADDSITFNGNAQDFYIGLDDSADDLVFGLGSAVGTTPAFAINENQVTTFSQNPLIVGSAPLLTIGDGGDEDIGVQLNSDTTDYYIASENALDDLQLGVGSAIGTTPAIGVDSAQNVQLYQNVTARTINFGVDAGTTDTYNITVQGYLPTLTTGMMVVFTGNTSNTGACTIDIDGNGAIAAKSIKAYNDTDPADNYIEALQPVMIVYGGTNWHLVSPDSNP